MVINAPKAYKSRDAEELEDEVCNQKKVTGGENGGKSPVEGHPEEAEESGGGYGMRNEREFPRSIAFLERVRKAQRRVKLLEDRIKCLQLMMTDIAVHMSEVHVRSSREPQKNYG